MNIAYDLDDDDCDDGLDYDYPHHRNHGYRHHTSDRDLGALRNNHVN